MKSIQSLNSTVHFNEKCYLELNSYISENNFSSIFIITDSNTIDACYPYFIEKLETNLRIEIISFDAGEEHKNIETCSQIWSVLSELEADRKSLIINLGGGITTDLGGFVACCFRRGIDFINIPTSLLAMVDASVGGKNGVDLDHLKNQIGIINPASLVLIDTNYLTTLPKEELRSGFAEMLKHGLISTEEYWNNFIDLSQLNLNNLDELIYESVIIKNNIVTKDPKEQGVRKTLNFGHTLGHAIETYCLNQQDKTTLLHGEAIAIGMILACFISTKKVSFSTEKCDDIKRVILSIFDKITFNKPDIENIIELLKFDKKNTHGKINFVLLSDFGKYKLDCQVENDLIFDAFEYYLS